MTKLKSKNVFFSEENIKRLVNKDQLMAYKHNGFWQPMDTLREKNILCELWKTNSAPWKVINNKRKIIPFRKAI